MGIVSTSTWGKMVFFTLETICVPNNKGLNKEILVEAHGVTNTVHPNSTKMYKDLKETYWWSNMKKDVTKFVARCLTCQWVKAKHQKPAGPLQPLNIPMWKWDHISMDFVVGLSKTQNGFDAIWVIINRLT